MSFFHKFRM